MAVDVDANQHAKYNKNLLSFASITRQVYSAVCTRKARILGCLGCSLLLFGLVSTSSSSVPVPRTRQMRSSPEPEPLLKPPSEEVVNIVFLVFPTSVDNDRHAERLQAMFDTWARNETIRQFEPFKRTWRISVRIINKHGNMRAGKKSDYHSLPAHARIWSPRSNDPTPQFAWALSEIFREYNIAHTEPNTLDLGNLWIVKIDTITYVVLENMLHYLSQLDASAPHFLGRRLRIDDEYVFCSGGAGFVVSGRAAARYVSTWDDCFHESIETNGWLMGARDVGVTTCFRKAGIEPNVTLDDRQRQRFHIFGPARTVKGNMDGWMTDYSNKINEPIQKGLECCSKESVTFHYMEGPEVRLIDDMIHNSAKWLRMESDERVAEWEKINIGGYSAVPDTDNAEMWSLLLDHLGSHIKKIHVSAGTNS